MGCFGFYCPKEKFRKLIDPEILIFMDTIEKSRFDDTNVIFERPNNKVDYSFKNLILIIKVI